MYKLTRVINRAAVPEELECRVAPDAIAFGKLLFLRGIDLSELDGRLLLGQFGGGLGVLRGEGLAVTAPWRICKQWV